MNWKEFLKPDWKKIILTIIILSIQFIFLLQVFLPYNFLFMIWIIFGGYLLFILNALLCSSSENLCLLGVIITFILSAIFWYLFSCLIAWVYDKMKKK
jgi:membrane-bound ClpP family serine protease